MRIANNIIFIAVVSLAACIEGWQRGTRSMASNESISDMSEEDTMVGWLKPKQRDYMLSKEMMETGQPADCCPSIVQMVEPQGGTNEDGIYVALWTEHPQRFYELSCRDGVADKPCNFMERSLHKQSKCVQKYSYSYAIIKTDHERLRHQHIRLPTLTSNWTLGYIKVRSGCSCVLYPRTKRKRSSHQKIRKGRRRESEEQ